MQTVIQPPGVLHFELEKVIFIDEASFNGGNRDRRDADTAAEDRLQFPRNQPGKMFPGSGKS